MPLEVKDISFKPLTVLSIFQVLLNFISHPIKSGRVNKIFDKTKIIFKIFNVWGLR